MKRIWAVGLLSLAIAGQVSALQQQSLLSTTLAEDTSPQQALVDRFSVPQAKRTTRQEILFEGYRVPNASHVDFSIPSGLYRQACTSCIYDTERVQCQCENGKRTELVSSYLDVKDCQQITVSTEGYLMCLDQVAKKKS